jgi:YVTN family beta-propeller protein
MVVAPAGASALTPFAYVTGSGPFAGLAVVNTATNAVVATVDTIPQTSGVATSPNGAFVYATSSAGLSVIDTSTNAVVDTIPVGSQPGQVAVTPDGEFAYVINEFSGVTVVNTSSRALVTTIPIALDPIGIAASPDGTRVYVVNSSNSVSVIDTATNTVVDNVPVGTFPEGMAVTPDGAFAYVANSFSDNVSVIDTASDTVVDTVPVGEYPFRVAFTPDGAFAYVTDRNGNAISVIDTATNSVVDTIPASNPEDVAITPSGAFAYVTNPISLLAVDTAAKAVTATIARGNSGEGSEVAITPPIAGPVTTVVNDGRPLVKITSGPAKETANRRATFTFAGVAGGSYECSIDNGAWGACASGQAFGPLAPGDHRFRVRESLHGITGPADSYRWTIDLPRKCVLRVARARVFAFTHQDRVRLVIHYTSYRFARVTVSYTLAGKGGALDLGEETARFAKAGVFRLPETLSAAEFARVQEAKLLRVRFSIPATPRSCGRYYTKRLTIPRKIFGQTVWFQSDSDFAP